jgi:hypothetical protein
MTTHAEFRRAAWQHWRHHIARCLSLFALGAFVFLVLWFLLAMIEPGEPAETRAEYAMATAVIVALAAAVMSARSAGNDDREDSRLYCPQCNTTLGYYYVAIVLSSGNCPHCGERLLDD